MRWMLAPFLTVTALGIASLITAQVAEGACSSNSRAQCSATQSSKLAQKTTKSAGVAANSTVDTSNRKAAQPQNNVTNATKSNSGAGPQLSPVRATTPQEKGVAGEKKAFGAIQDKHNTGVKTRQGTYFPDKSTSKTLVEVKNQQYVTYSENLPKAVEAAKSSGKRLEVIIPENGKISGPAARAIESTGGSVTKMPLPKGVSSGVAGATKIAGVVGAAVTVVDVGNKVAQGNTKGAICQTAGAVSGYVAGATCGSAVASTGAGALLAVPAAIACGTVTSIAVEKACSAATNSKK
jgi:hypothetical protein